MELTGSNGSSLNGWERKETELGIPYYIDLINMKTQWNHPCFVKLQKQMMECNNIKYAAYRTAAKLLVIQKYLSLYRVRLGVVAAVFEHHKLRTTENEVFLDCSEMDPVVSDIYFAAHKENVESLDIELATELTINLILSVFDVNHKGTVPVAACKVLLTVLCSGRLQDKYLYLFRQFADHNHCVGRRSLSALLTYLACIPTFLSESLSFGSALVSSAVDSCFQKVEGILGLTEEALLSWMLQEPQPLVWWSTLYRMKASESICHNVRCSVCKALPIRGFRYQCLRCLKYDMCQDCFFVAQVSRGHKLKHPMQEYCQETTSKETTLAFMKVLKNKLSRRSSSKPRYLPVEPVQEAGQHMAVALSRPREPPPRGTEASGDEEGPECELFSRTILQGSSEDLAREDVLPDGELHSIIVHLEEENRQLQFEIDKLGILPIKPDSLPRQVEEKLQDHQSQLQTQVNRLKLLFQTYSQRGKAPPKRLVERLESTPAVVAHSRSAFKDLSPIANFENKQLGSSATTHEKQHLNKDQLHCQDTPSITFLPSLTEYSLQDLTEPLAASSHASEEKFTDTLDSSNIIHLTRELDQILEKLEVIFPKDVPQSGAATNRGNSMGVLNTACEMGDLIDDMVLPFCGNKENKPAESTYM